MADDPGVLKTAPEAPGAAQYRNMTDAAGAATANDWKAETAHKMYQAGASPKDIDDYFGDNQPAPGTVRTTPGQPSLQEHVENNVGTWLNSMAGSVSKDIQGFDAKAAWNAGYGRSVTGLLHSQGAMPKPLPQNASFTSSLFADAAQFMGDAPYMLAGAKLGAAGGAAVPGGGETGLTELIGGAFGAGATPEAMRHILVDAHNAHRGMTEKDVFNVITKGVTDTIKAGTVNTLSLLVGGKAGGTVLKAGAKPIVAGAVNAATMATTATALNGTMNGKLPTASDWASGAVLALTTGAVVHAATRGGGEAPAPKGAPEQAPPGGETQVEEKAGGINDWKSSRTRAAQQKVEKNLQSVYTQTGITPWESVGAAQHDPALHEELMGQDVNGDPNIAKHLALAPNEPAPAVPRIAPPKEEKPGEAPTGKPLTARDLVPALERSADDAVSPAGAIGKHQIMPGTARQYMGKDFDVQTLFDPKVNEQVFHHVMNDLERRFPDDPEAQLAAYNAGPGAAAHYVASGPGTRLVAIKNANVRGGIRYESEPTDRSERGLPMETQQYLARARLLGVGKAGKAEDIEDLSKLPEHDGIANSPENIAAEQARKIKEARANAPTDEELMQDFERAPEGLDHLNKGPEEEANKAAEPETAAGGGGNMGGSVGAKSTWEDADWKDIKEEILSNVGEAPEEKRSLSAQVGDMLSELSPARNIDGRLQNLDRNKQIGVEDTLRDTYASNDRARVFIEHGIIDPRTGAPVKGSPSYKKALKLAGGDKQGLMAYMMARRTVNLADNAGIDTGINLAASRAAVADPEARKQFEEAAQAWDAVNDGGLAYAQAKGLYSPEQIAAMQAVSDVYVTLRKVADPGSFAPGGRFNVRDPLKRMVGGDGKVINPLLANVDNLRLLLTMADRNQARLNILDMASKDPELATLLGVREVKNFDPNEDEIDEALREYGFSDTQLEQARKAYAPMVAQRLEKGLPDNEFLVFENGQPKRVAFDNPDVARMLKTMSSPQEQNLIISALRIPAAVSRLGTMLDPTFLPRTVLKHQWTQFINDPMHPLPVITWARAAIHSVTGSDLYYEVMSRGGLGGTPTDLRSLGLVADLDKTFEETGVWDKAWNMLKWPLEASQWLHERTWAANNIGLYLNNLDRGLGEAKAAMSSRRSGVDYAERSASAMVDAVSKVSPFWITSVRGAKLTWEALADKPVTTLALALGTVTSLTVLNHILNTMHDRSLPPDQKANSYQNVARWQRDAGLVLPPVAGQRVIIRYPFQYGILFGAMTDRIMDKYLDQDPHAYDDMAKNVLNGFGLGPEAPSAPALLTPMEMLANYNFYTGKPLVSDTLMQRTGPMQYTEATTAPAKALAKVLNPMWQYTGTQASPIAIEHLVQGWTGEGGMEVLRALNAPWAKTEPGNELHDNPFLKGFLIRHPGMDAQKIADFYNDKDHYDALHTDLKATIKGQMTGAMSPEDLASQLQNAPEALRAAQLDGIAKAISVQRVVLNSIVQNKEMTPAEKRQAYDAIVSQAITFAEFGTKMAKSEVQPQ